MCLLDDVTFVALLDLCDSGQPVDDALVHLANRDAVRRGFRNWPDARAAITARP